MATSRKRTVEIDVVVDDKQASSKLKGVGDEAQKSGKGFSDLSTGMKTAALGAGAFVATNIVSFLGDATTAAMEDEKAQVDLARQLRDSTGATDGQIKKTEEWIDATARATGIADDELRPALETLARGTGDLQEAQEYLTRAMDIATATGKPLQAVVEAISKAALNGSTGGLARLGLKIKDVNGDMLSLDEIMENAADTMGGATAEAAETAAGKMDRLKIAFDESKEEIGGYILQALVPLADALQDVFTQLDKPFTIEPPKNANFLEETLDDFRQFAHIGEDPSIQAIIKWFQDFDEWASIFEDKATRGAASAEKLAYAVGTEAQGAMEEIIPDLSDVAGGIGEVEDATRQSTDAFYDHKDAMQAQMDPLFNYQEAHRGLIEAKLEVLEAEKEHGKNSPEYIESLLGVREAAVKLEEAEKGVATQATVTKEEMRTQLRAMGQLTEDEIDTIIAEMERINAFKFKTKYVDIINRSRPGGPQEHHTGGTVQGVPGSEVPILARAGEFVSQGGRDPHGNGNGGPLIVQVNVDGKRFIEELVVPQLARYSRRNGGLGI